MSTDTPSVTVSQSIIEAIKERRAVRARLAAEAKAAEERENRARARRVQSAVGPILDWINAHYGYDFTGIPDAHVQVDETENENGRFHYLTFFISGRGQVSFRPHFRDGQYSDPVDPYDPDERNWYVVDSRFSQKFSDPRDAFEFLGF